MADGKECTCGAYGEHECGCGADWSCDGCKDMEEVAQIIRERAQKAEAKVEKLKAENERLYGKLNMLQRVQAGMRDPERTLVCDILANGSLLPDPEGRRYGEKGGEA